MNPHCNISWAATVPRSSRVWQNIYGTFKVVSCIATPAPNSPAVNEVNSVNGVEPSLECAMLSLSTIMNDLRKIKYNSNTAGFKVRVILNVEKHGKLDAERESSVFLKLMCN